MLPCGPQPKGGFPALHASNRPEMSSETETETCHFSHLAILLCDVARQKGRFQGKNAPSQAIPLAKDWFGSLQSSHACTAETLPQAPGLTIHRCPSLSARLLSCHCAISAMLAVSMLAVTKHQTAVSEKVVRSTSTYCPHKFPPGRFARPNSLSSLVAAGVAPPGHTAATVPSPPRKEKKWWNTAWQPEPLSHSLSVGHIPTYSLRGVLCRLRPWNEAQGAVSVMPMERGPRPLFPSPPPPIAHATRRQARAGARIRAIVHKYTNTAA
mmetsp:Transcript_8052/g.14341  ORF Transcript_8052/g.14341 Transcript_8052/m.14341 type:complete len:268 (-) Transcript_8052:1230-2033(-)